MTEHPVTRKANLLSKGQLVTVRWSADVNSHSYWALAQAYMSVPFILLSQTLGRYSQIYWAKPYFSSYILGQTVLFFPNALSLFAI